jgi:hypothetical protein
MQDDELLDGIYESCREIREMAWKKAAIEFVTPLVDDSRWLSPYPLKPELQLRHLFLQSLDAFDLAAIGLRARTSSASIGSVRLLAECCVLVRWLTEVEGTEQRKRAYRLAMDGIKRLRRMGKHGLSATDAQLDAMKKRLNEIARDEGIQHVGDAPDPVHLFNTYLKQGYVVFSVLSELGSHAGFFQVVLFHLDSQKEVVAVDFDGATVERAMWTASAFEFFGYTTDEIGKSFGWNDWLQADVLPVVQRAAPLMNEIRERWEQRWEAPTSSGSALP